MTITIDPLTPDDAHRCAELEQLLEDVIGGRHRFTPAGPSTDGPHVVIVLDGADLHGATQLDDDRPLDPRLSPLAELKARLEKKE